MKIKDYRRRAYTQQAVAEAADAADDQRMRQGTPQPPFPLRQDEEQGEKAEAIATPADEEQGEETQGEVAPTDEEQARTPRT